MPRTASATLSWGSWTTGYFVPVEPTRLVDTRTPGSFDFKRLPGNVVRVKVTSQELSGGTGRVPTDAVAAVVNITKIGRAHV